MSTPVRVVVVSEEATERQDLTRALDGLPGIETVAEVDLVCEMGKQAGNIDTDCVVLDIDRYPLAGTLGLAQARGTFPGARVIVLARSIHPRFLQFLKDSGGSCCIDKDDPGKLTHLISALLMVAPGAGLTISQVDVVSEVRE
ncbi:MAG: hypothetical protein ACE5LU_04230 [Anaerolineae bacterium]